MTELACLLSLLESSFGACGKHVAIDMEPGICHPHKVHALLFVHLIFFRS